MTLASPRCLVAVLVGLVAGGCGRNDEAGAEEGTHERAPSVLLLIADDLGRHDLGVLGLRSCPTPHLDALADAGLVLHRAYTPSPSCRPARAAIATGLYPHHTGRSWDGPVGADLPEWSALFAQAGHVAGEIGKTAGAGGGTGLAFWDRGTAALSEFGAPSVLADLTGQFLDEVGERPFSLIVNFYDPHRPFNIPAASGGEDGPESSRQITPPPNLPPTDLVLGELGSYYRSVRRLDRSVGALLEVLGERGRSADTLVIFLSDNGASFPFAKGTLSEAGLNMPLVVRWPGIVAAGSETSALLSFIDLLPTALDACGLAVPAGLDGSSLLALLAGRTGAHRELVFGEQDEQRKGGRAPSRSVVGARFKYVRHFQLDEPLELAWMGTPSWSSMVQLGRKEPVLAERMHRAQVRPREEFFDLELDPWELENLADGELHTAHLDRLRGELRSWMEAQDDPLLAEWGD